MKLMYIAESAGGVLKYIERLSKKMPDEVKQIGLFSLRHREKFDKDLSNIEHKEYIEMKSKRSFGDNYKLVKEIRESVKRNNPDIVYIHGSKISFVARIACMNLNVKVIFNSHGWNFKGSTNMNGNMGTTSPFWERFFAKRTDVIINSTTSEENLAIKNKLKPRIGLVKIDNGIDFGPYEELHNNEEKMEEVKKRIREELNISEFEKAIALVGNINDKKDPMTFVKANLELIRMGYNLKMIFIGEGDKADTEEVIKFAEENNILNKIEITGWVDNLPEYLVSMDIGVLTSNRESSAVSIIEFMAAKIPAIGANLDSIPEMLNYGKNGRLFDRGDVGELTQKIQQTFIDMNSHNIKLDATYDYAIQHYNLLKMANNHIKVYNILLDS